MSDTEIIELVVKAGLPSALVLWFVWENRGREEARNDRLKALETFQTEVLLNLVKDHTELQTQTNQIMSESTRTIEAALRILEANGNANTSDRR